MRILPAQTLRDRVHEHLPLLRYADKGSCRNGANTVENARETDTLAFLLIVFLAVMSEMQGLTQELRIPTILRTMAEDATRYFLVIFTAHLVFVLTLNLGRVSAMVSLPELRSMTFNTLVSRKQYNFFRDRESS